MKSDGNRRTWLAAVLAVLGLSAYRLDTDPEELEKFVLRIPAGTTSKAELTVFV